MHSFTEENYLKTIYKLSQSHTEGVSTNALAEATQTKPSSVSDMLKKLSDKNLIDYKKYQGVRLTEEGEKIALQIIRNHRLWEVFLVQKLRFNWDEVHEIAEELEHITHHQLINRLDEFLGFPAFDPHGDPIPSANGEIQPAQHVPLHDLQVNEKGLVAGVKESSNSLLQYLDKIGLKIGSACFVVEHIAFDNSVEILIEKDKKVIISREVARNVLISPQAN